MSDLVDEAAATQSEHNGPDGDSYSRDRYRAAMSAMHAGTFELGPFVAQSKLYTS